MQLLRVTELKKYAAINFVVAILSLCLLTACSTMETSPESIVNNQPVLAPACLIKPDVGRCRAAIRRFYFDKERGQCQMFLWGGCEGSVPFKTLEQCQNSCEL